jgi:hypothetical protein
LPIKNTNAVEHPCPADQMPGFAATLLHEDYPDFSIGLLEMQDDFLVMHGWCKVGRLSLGAKRQVSFAPYERDFSRHKPPLEMTSRDCQGALQQPCW